MPIVVRFLSGSLTDRDFSFPGEVVRVGDAEGVDLRVDPAAPGDGGARGRVIEISTEGPASGSARPATGTSPRRASSRSTIRSPTEARSASAPGARSSP